MKTLVTGASGFVGSAIVRQLLDADHSVRVLLRPNSPKDNIAGLDVETSIGDLTDTSSLKQAANGCTALFHAAADYRLWAPHPQSMYATNVDGTHNIMQAALDAGIERIVYTSSVATLGLNQDGTPAGEEAASSLDHMIGHYKRSKFMAEAIVKDMVAVEGLPAVIVNPSTPVGPRDIKPTPTGKMILDAARGRMPAYVDTGLNIVHVDDVATGHLLALDRGTIGERYILGGENMSLKDILSRRTHGKKTHVLFLRQGRTGAWLHAPSRHRGPSRCRSLVPQTRPSFIKENIPASSLDTHQCTHKHSG